MQYKKIVLELLQQRMEMHGPASEGKDALPAMEQFARDLKTATRRGRNNSRA